jgi:hypothetical protein
MAVKDAPAQKVGNPSGRPNADADSSTTTVSAIPIAASFTTERQWGHALDRGDLCVERRPLRQSQCDVCRKDRNK